MDNSRSPFQCLYKVGFNCILQKRCHCSLSLQITGKDRLVGKCIANKNVAQSSLEVIKVLRHA